MNSCSYLTLCVAVFICRTCALCYIWVRTCCDVDDAPGTCCALRIAVCLTLLCCIAALTSVSLACWGLGPNLRLTDRLVCALTGDAAGIPLKLCASLGSTIAVLVCALCVVDPACPLLAAAYTWSGSFTVIMLNLMCTLLHWPGFFLYCSLCAAACMFWAGCPI